MLRITQSILLNGAGVAVFQENGQDANPVLSENFPFARPKSRNRLHDFRKARSVRLWPQTLDAVGELFQDPGVLDGFVARINKIPRFIVDFELRKEKLGPFIGASM